ncbi:AAA family ATPase [Trichothermofontia sp.]
MQILSVSLKNFKAHRDRYLEFQMGTNAICGENGAGKTSILEAIAWTLFDYSSYNKAELIRKGAASTQAIVTFISHQDHRTYRVRRCTSKGYEIYDPQAKVNLEIKRVEEEVIPWLQSHLGVPTHTKLADLFVNIIGIPQGTFTVDFLKTAEQRKRVFDPILKVEEYKKVYKESLRLENYAKAQVADLERTIADLDSRLSDWQTLQTQYTQCEAEVQQDEKILSDLTTQIAELTQQLSMLQAEAKTLQGYRDTLQQLATQITSQIQLRQTHQELLAKAQSATKLCQINQVSYDTYQAAEQALQALAKQQKQVQTLQKQRDFCQQQLNQLTMQMAESQGQMQRLATLEQELTALTPLLQQQQILEMELTACDRQLQTFLAYRNDRQLLSRQQEEQQTRLAQVTVICDRLQTLAPIVATIPDLEAQVERYQVQLARLGAARQFEQELRALLTWGETERDRFVAQIEAVKTAFQTLATAAQLDSQIREQVLTALATGQTLSHELLSHLAQIYTDLQHQTNPEQLQVQLATAQQALTQAYDSRAQFQTLPDHQAQQTQVQAMLQDLATRLTELEAELAQEPAVQQQRDRHLAALQALNDPRGRMALRQQELQHRDAIAQRYAQQQAQQQPLTQQLADLEQQLATFADLDDRMEHQTQIKQAYQAGYVLFIENKKEADRQTEYQATYDEICAQIERLEAQQTEVQTTYDRLLEQHDAERLQVLQAEISQANDRKNQLLGGLPAKRENCQRLAAELEHRAAIAAQLQQTQQELAQCHRIRQFISDARQVYNLAGPRITQYYLAEISREADRLFRELLTRENVALEWTPDYEIRVQESGHWRNFKSLSGGEQMCAALAVRLALLRTLAEIDVAFFDEPTTNMDRQRRQQLAEALTNLRSFRQLFVISHDDTFENLTENVIRLQRETQ